MAKPLDNCVSVYPVFSIKTGKEQAIRDLINLIISRAQEEDGTLIFTAAYADSKLFLRESYAGIQGFKAHLDSVSDVLDTFFGMLDLVQLTIVAPKQDEESMKNLVDELGMNASIYIIESGFAG